MNATILSNNDQHNHYPVLLKEILSIISPQNGGTFIDCTFGQGGYSESILKFPKTKVIAIDRDSNCEKIARSIKEKNKNRFFFHNIRFSELDKIKKNLFPINGIIFDLGYSYTQIKDLSKGLSFESKGPLNMKMGLNNFSASEVVNNLDEKDLYLIFKYFGDERDSRKIAKKIVFERAKGQIDNEKLLEIIDKVKKNKNQKIHKATKIFQALRIFVNKEVSELIYGLINSVKILNKEGFILVVSFHSLEDRIIKYFFKNLSEHVKISRYQPELKKEKNILKTLNKKPITPTKEEIRINRPSRSAKLRSVMKISERKNFEIDILKKFKNLLEIENLSEKL